MNECFLLGEITKIGDFRFIYGEKLIHKSAIELTLKTLKNQAIKCVAFDNVADYIYRKDFKYVCIMRIDKNKRIC